MGGALLPVSCCVLGTIRCSLTHCHSLPQQQGELLGKKAKETVQALLKGRQGSV